VEEVARGSSSERIPPTRSTFASSSTSSPRFSRAALETLSIIAYKQPVTRLEIEQIRGVDCADRSRP
jgi:chromosome segregation and condensation protein ScpB